MNFFDFGKLFLSITMVNYDKALTVRAEFSQASGYVDPSRCKNLLAGVSHVSLCITDIVTSKNLDVSLYILNGILDMPIEDVQDRIYTRAEGALDPRKISYYLGARYPILQ